MPQKDFRHRASIRLTCRGRVGCITERRVLRRECYRRGRHTDEKGAADGEQARRMVVQKTSHACYTHRHASGESVEVASIIGIRIIGTGFSEHFKGIVCYITDTWLEHPTAASCYSSCGFSAAAEVLTQVRDTEPLQVPNDDIALRRSHQQPFLDALPHPKPNALPPPR